MTREEHLAWAKARAIRELEYNGDLAIALASMGSDLDKHPETLKHPATALGVQMLLAGLITTPEQMREFIAGYQ
jgi:hypothetical protein